jgi:hypothetical protein
MVGYIVKGGTKGVRVVHVTGMLRGVGRSRWG